jgi:hypothetical protein
MRSKIKYLKIWAYLELRRRSSTKKLETKFHNRRVLKPYDTVLKPPYFGDTPWSKSFQMRNQKSHLLEWSVLDNFVLCALDLYISREQHIWGHLVIFLNIFISSSLSSRFPIKVLVFLHCSLLWSWYLAVFLSIACCGLDYLHLYCLLGVGVEIYIKEREFLWQRRSHICRSRSCKFFLLFYLCCVHQNLNFICFYLPWVARSHSGI